MKYSINSLCPCGSGVKYKKCCQYFHNGKIPKTALELMKSRFSGYAFSLWKYIIQTTHKDNLEFSHNTEIWKNEILHFCSHTTFEKLVILEFIDGECEAYVTFQAILISNGDNVGFIEKSKFLKINGKWLYFSGELSPIP